jgi:thioredoxin reductase
LLDESAAGSHDGICTRNMNRAPWPPTKCSPLRRPARSRRFRRLKTCTEITGLDGDSHVGSVNVRDLKTAATTSMPIRHVFVMTCAVPATGWLARTPHLLETNHPGIFAVGDVRSGDIKRVASAVGEGSTAVSFVHSVLHE